MNILSTTIAAIAFDMDGLILNTEDLYEEVGDILLKRRGKSYRDEVRKLMIGLPAPQAFGVLIAEEGLSDSWEELQAETDEVFESLLPEKLEPMPGLLELLEQVESLQIPKCVATSSTRSFATKALGQVNLLERFEFVLTAADVEKGKPHPHIYLESAKRLGAPVERMLVLEDSPTGTKAGVSAGAYVVSVPNDHTKHGDFTGCKWIANTLRDPRLKELLQR